MHTRPSDLNILESNLLIITLMD